MKKANERGGRQLRQQIFQYLFLGCSHIRCLFKWILLENLNVIKKRKKAISIKRDSVYANAPNIDC